MKGYKIGVICALLANTGFLSAQSTIYDANRWMGSDLNGTARFVGMGGAMGSLGGDVTTMGTNPAGIGIYRSNDAMISFGLENTGMTVKNGTSKDKFRGTFDNAGFVFATKISNTSALRFANVGFNYRKMKSFNKEMLTAGTFGTSQTIQMANLLNYDSRGDLKPWGEDALTDKNAFSNTDLAWLGLMAYNASLVDPNYEKNADNKEVLDRYYPHFQTGDKVAQSYHSKESGGIHSFDLNGALNFYDRFYVGATLGLYTVDYKRDSEYNEDFTDVSGNGQGGYTLGNHFKVDGSGVDFKLGFIFRPIESSSFRIGAAIHTPTYFSLTERNSAYIDYDLQKTKTDGSSVIVKGVTKPYDGNDRETEGEYEYKLITPWKFNVNMGYTVGSAVALGLEYEYMDRSAGKMKDWDNYELGQTDDIKAMMKGVHTLRAGIEIKMVPEFSLRLGYNYITSPMKSDAFKYIPDNSMRTDTEFSNLGATNNYTFGCGYRGKNFYADMAYVYNTYKETFYTFDNLDLPGTEITNDNHKVMITLGVRF